MFRTFLYFFLSISSFFSYGRVHFSVPLPHDIQPIENQMIQDQQGFPWILSKESALRFDGQQWKKLRQFAVNDSFNQSFKTFYYYQPDQIWLLGEEYLEYYSMRTNRFTKVLRFHPHANASQFAILPNDHLVVLFEDQLKYYDANGRVLQSTRLNKQFFPMNPVVSENQLVWFFDQNGMVFHYNPLKNVLQRHPIIDAKIIFLQPTQQHIWALSEQGAWYKISLIDFSIQFVKKYSYPTHARSKQGIDGSIWLVNSSLVQHIYPDTQLHRQIFLNNNLNSIDAIVPNREGGIWLLSQSNLSFVHDQPNIADYYLTKPRISSLKILMKGDKSEQYLFSERYNFFKQIQQAHIEISRFKPASARYRFLFSPDMKDWLLEGERPISYQFYNIAPKSELIIQQQDVNQHWQNISRIQLNHMVSGRTFDFSVQKILALLAALSLIGMVVMVFWLRLRQKQADDLLHSLLENTHEGVWIANQDFEISYINQAFSEITGFTLDEMCGSPMTLFSHGGDHRRLGYLIEQEVNAYGFWSGEVWSRRKNGDDFSMDLSITRVDQESTGYRQVHFIGMFTDITFRMQNERELRKLATRDSLTKLPNRTLFFEHLDKAIYSASEQFPSFIVMIVDIDKFHKINDTLGLKSGDELLMQVAQILEQNLERGHILSRLGGDEFAIMIPPYLLGEAPDLHAEHVATRLSNCFREPIMIDGVPITATTSIGISLFPMHGMDAKHLMRSADAALTHAKQAGKNGFCIFNREIDVSTPEQLRIESEMWQSLKSKGFTVFYQPKISSESGKVVGTEALVRWFRDGDPIGPGEFIPIAEENGMIIPLTMYILEHCCQQVKQWQDQGMLRGKVAINISSLHFQKDSMAQEVFSLVSKYGVSPAQFELEITETAMMQAPDFALQQMRRLKDYGFSIALDDFGTGHSSLSYLKRFPIDKLKIDRSFICHLDTEEQDRNITATIIRLAKYLNMHVVAEGVESAEQVKFLSVMGCDELQGYYFSKPLPPEELILCLKEEKLPTALI